jgi:hypothetical protein
MTIRRTPAAAQDSDPSLLEELSYLAWHLARLLNDPRTSEGLPCCAESSTGPLVLAWRGIFPARERSRQRDLNLLGGGQVAAGGA